MIQLCRYYEPGRGDCLALLIEDQVYNLTATGKVGLLFVFERPRRLRVEGVACVHLVQGRCLLGELKSPLCLCYMCDPVRDALAAAAGRDVPGEDADDFCGSREALRAVGAGRPEGTPRRPWSGWSSAWRSWTRPCGRPPAGPVGLRTRGGPARRRSRRG